MFSVIKSIFRIFALIDAPEHLPYSKKIFAAVAVISIMVQALVANSVVDLAPLNNSIKSPLSSFTTIDFVVLELVRFVFICAWMYSCLWYFKKTSRFVQVTMAFNGVNIILAVCFLLIMILWQYAKIVFVLFFVLLYWNFILIIHIFVSSYEISGIKAGLLSILYMFIQHNVGNLVISALVK